MLLALKLLLVAVFVGFGGLVQSLLDLLLAVTLLFACLVLTLLALLMLLVAVSSRGLFCWLLMTVVKFTAGFLKESLGSI